MDFEDKNAHKSFGKQLFEQQKIKGIRGQAAAGYPAVKPAFELLKECLNKGDGVDTAGAKTLCLLMSQLEDTNVIKRSDTDTLKKVQQKTAQILESDNFAEEFAALNDEFVKLNISHGGCADLLAICFLLYFICEE